ncbi:MAG: FecR domain-containing protein [Pseudomonadota bacterium]
MEKTLDTKTQRALEEAHQWLILMEDPEKTIEEETRFKQWLNADDLNANMYDRAVTVKAAVSTLTPPDIDEDLRWMPSPTRHENMIVRFWRSVSNTDKRLVFGGAFATIALLILAISTLQDYSSDVPQKSIVVHYESDIGETKTIELIDGTVVTLGAKSAISTAFTQERRVVNLIEGSAYFDVVSDVTRPFSVKTDDLIAKAVGTSFDVRNSAGIYRVAVEEGRVEVGYPIIIDGKSTTIIEKQVLNVGQGIAASQSEGLQAVTALDISAIAAWREGRFVYSGASVSEFVGDVNRYSSVPIRISDQYPEMKTLKISGVFLSRDAEQLLLQLTDIHPIKIDRTDPSFIMLSLKTGGN